MCPRLWGPEKGGENREDEDQLWQIICEHHLGVESGVSIGVGVEVGVGVGGHGIGL